jgi:hypothetical protein
VAPACVGAVVAGIMATRFLALIADNAPVESRELAFDLKHDRFLESRLRRAPRCRFNHQIVQDIVSISGAAPLGDLAALIEGRLGTNLAHVEGRRLTNRGGLTTSRFLSLAALRARAGEPVSGLGVAPGTGLRARSGTRSLFVVVES